MQRAVTLRKKTAELCDPDSVAATPRSPRARTGPHGDGATRATLPTLVTPGGGLAVWPWTPLIDAKY